MLQRICVIREFTNSLSVFREFVKSLMDQEICEFPKITEILARDFMKSLNIFYSAYMFQTEKVNAHNLLLCFFRIIFITL